MKEIYIGIGISGSGKSTYLKKHNPNALWLNADDIREELSGDAGNQTVSKDAFKLLYERIENSMRDNSPLVVDNTTLTEKDRDKIVSHITNGGIIYGNLDYRITLVFFKPDYERSLIWNRQRSKVVPCEVIERQFNKIEPPTDIELNKYRVIIL